MLNFDLETGTLCRNFRLQFHDHQISDRVNCQSKFHAKIKYVKKSGDCFRLLISYFKIF